MFARMIREIVSMPGHINTDLNTRTHAHTQNSGMKIDSNKHFMKLVKRLSINSESLMVTTGISGRQFFCPLFQKQAIR